MTDQVDNSRVIFLAAQIDSSLNALVLIGRGASVGVDLVHRTRPIFLVSASRSG